MIRVGVGGIQYLSLSNPHPTNYGYYGLLVRDLTQMGSDSDSWMRSLTRGKQKTVLWVLAKVFYAKALPDF